MLAILGLSAFVGDSHLALSLGIAGIAVALALVNHLLQKRLQPSGGMAAA